MRRRVLALLAIVLLAVAAAPGQAVAGPVAFRIMTFNVCGNVCRLGEVDRVTNNIVYQVRRHNAAVAMLQELCYSQFRVLRSRLADYGYTAVFGDAARGAHCAGNAAGHGRFGVAIVARGVISGTTVRRLPSPFESKPEQRVALAVNVCLSGRSVLVVVTHTAPRGPNLRVQLAALKSWLVPLAAIRPVIFGGDLNSLPESLDLDGFYAGYHEADGDRAEPLPTFVRPARKIDYLFGARRYLQPQEASTACNGYSDHCMYFGTFS